jgi:chemotaxis protein MotB
MARRSKPPEDHDGGERWLLTYSDMITLLLALFVVLFSISSVNISKYITLQQSLRAAFSGGILTGGSSILQSGSDSTATHSPNNTEIPSLVPLTPTIPKPVDQGAAQGSVSQAQLNALLSEAQNSSQETTDFVQLEHILNAYSKAHGWSNQVRAQIQQRGLVVTVLTDNLLFASGQDTLQPAGLPLLNEIATLIGIDPEKHPVVVEGYTDNVPISTAQFPNNFALSSGRADTVLEYLLSRDVDPTRMSVAGFAYEDPIASNATPQGRAQNRRVEIVFERKYPAPSPGA